MIEDEDGERELTVVVLDATAVTKHKLRTSYRICVFLYSLIKLTTLGQQIQ